MGIEWRNSLVSVAIMRRSGRNVWSRPYRDLVTVATNAEGYFHKSRIPTMRRGIPISDARLMLANDSHDQRQAARASPSVLENRCAPIVRCIVVLSCLALEPGSL